MRRYARAPIRVLRAKKLAARVEPQIWAFTKHFTRNTQWSLWDTAIAVDLTSLYVCLGAFGCLPTPRLKPAIFNTLLRHRRWVRASHNRPLTLDWYLQQSTLKYSESLRGRQTRRCSAIQKWFISCRRWSRKAKCFQQDLVLFAWQLQFERKSSTSEPIVNTFGIIECNDEKLETFMIENYVKKIRQRLFVPPNIATSVYRHW